MDHNQEIINSRNTSVIVHYILRIIEILWHGSYNGISFTTPDCYNMHYVFNGYIMYFMWSLLGTFNESEFIEPRLMVQI